MMAKRREIVVNLPTRVLCDPDRKRLVSIAPKPVSAPFFRHQLGLHKRGDGGFEFAGVRRMFDAW